MAFYIFIIYGNQLKHFMKIGQKLCTGAHKRIVIHYQPMDRICQFMAVNSDCTIYTKINIHFFRAQKRVINDIWFEYHSCLVYRATQNNSDTMVTMVGKSLRFMLIYEFFLNKFNFKNIM